MTGSPGEPATRIARVSPDRVEVRGRDLTRDLMGRLTFTEHFHLLLTGREPTDEQRFFLDLLLVAIAEHGLTPTTVSARMTLAADPGTLRRLAEGSGGLAAPLDSAGPVMERLRSPELLRVRLAEMDLFHNPLLFAILILALTLEWALRRRFNLM